MDTMTALQTSFSGLHAQRIRMNVLATNLANASTTRTPEEGPYRPQHVIFGATKQLNPFDQLLSREFDRHVHQVHVVDIVSNPEAIRLEYDPTHPDANPQGYVAYPDINVVQEMVDLLATTRSYEANITAINAAKEMAARALQIGRTSA
jgi:flagellar basal-body rod protein FlgC